MRNLIVILGDQLSLEISSLNAFDPKQDQILMMEVDEETTYVPHHPQKLILVLASMRHFAARLERKKYKVSYIKLDCKNSLTSFSRTLEKFLEKNKPKKIIVTEPSEYRVKQAIINWREQFNIVVDIREDSRFFCSLNEFKEWAKDKKLLRMENFYRMMRKKHKILMNNNQPMGGQWNYDKQNRKPANDMLKFPQRQRFKKDSITKEVIYLVKSRFKNNFGEVDGFNYAVTRQQALKALDNFINQYLIHFGDLQDAMLENETFLNHSVLSGYLNIGLLLPKEVCKAVEEAYFANRIPINNVEGFIRQILGWREFIRGIYWLHMPKYQNLNYLSAKQKLPAFYWNGKTKMRCLNQVINFTKAYAYSHHIQRLMITGNFALLIGVDPKEVCEWYLSVYIDAFDWVEMPNTLGMAIFADGGIVGSKPYVASGNYINKMSNFCKNCHYNVKQKLGESACPFNYLYWNFLLQHKEKLSGNQRLKFAYNQLAKIDKKTKTNIKTQAEEFIHSLYV